MYLSDHNITMSVDTREGGGGNMNWDRATDIATMVGVFLAAVGVFLAAR